MILSHHMIMVSCAVLWDSRRCLVQCDNGLCNKASFVQPERWVRSPLYSPQEMKHHWSPMSCSFSESPSQLYLVCLGDSEILFPTKQILTYVSALETLTLKRAQISLGAAFIFSRCVCDLPLLLGKNLCFSKGIKPQRPFFSHMQLTINASFGWSRLWVGGFECL